MNNLLIKKNIISNFAYVIIMGLMSVFMIPVYFNILGDDQWGLVAVCIALQGFLSIMELGLSQFMPREFANAKKANNLRFIFSACLRVYFVLGTIAFLLIHLMLYFDDFIINIPALFVPDSIFVIRIFLFQFFFAFLNNVSISYFIGIQRQVEGNIRLLLFAVMKHILAFLSLQFMSPTAFTYVLVFAIVCGVETATNFLSIRKEIIIEPLKSNDGLKLFYKILQTSGGFSIAVLLGMLCSQFDRFYLMSALNTADYGVYILVTTIGLYMMHLQSPIQKALLPVLVGTDSGIDEKKTFLKHMYLVILICVFPCVILSLTTEHVIFIWLGDADVARNGSFLLSLILIAVALNSVYSVFYNIFIKYNKYIMIASINLLSLLVQFVVAFIFDVNFYLGGYLWLSVGVTQLVAVFLIFSTIEKRKLFASN